MAILQQGNAVFYHPLDSDVESLQVAAWGGPLDQGLGKVAGAAVVAPSEVFDPPATFGPQSDFLFPGTAVHLSVVAVSSTTVVVAYQDNSDFTHGTSKVGTVSGTDITWGLETEFRSAATTQDISIDALDPTHVVVGYGHTAFGACKVGLIVGTTVAWGVEHLSVEGTSSIQHSVMVAISATSFVWLYVTDNNPAKAVVGTVSGTDITLGVSVPFGSGHTHLSLGAVKIASNRVAYAFGHIPFTGSIAGFSVGTLSISGTTLSNTGAVELRDTDTTSPSPDDVKLVRMSDNRFVALFRYQMTAAVSGAALAACMWNGAAIDVGPLCQVSTTLLGGSQPRALVALDTDRVMALGDNGDASVHKVSGTQVFAGTTTQFNTLSPASDITLLAPGRVVIVFQDDEIGEDPGRAIVGEVASRPWISGSGTPYPTTVGATRLAFSSWHREPSGDLVPEQPTFGLDTEFLSADGVDDLAITALDATHVVVAYEDVSAGGSGRVKVGEVISGVISWGIDVVLNSDPSTQVISIARIDASRVFIVYGRGTGVFSKIGVVFGTTLTITTETTIEVAASVIRTAAGVFSDGRVFAAWHRSDNFINFRSGTVDGSNVITFSAVHTSVNASGSGINGSFDAAVFGADRVALAWGQNGSGSSLKIEQHTAGSFNSIASQFLNGVPTPLALPIDYRIAGKLGDPGIVLSTLGSGSSRRRTTMQAFRMNGTTLVAGRQCERPVSSNSSNFGIAKLNADTYVVMDSLTADNSGQTTTIRVTKGLWISSSDSVTFAANTGIGRQGHVTFLGAGAFVVAYRDQADFNHGTARVGSIALPVAVTTTVPPTTVPPTTTPPPVGSISYGSAVLATPAAEEHIGPSIIKFDSTRMVLCYMKQGVLGAWARVATVTGSDITFGAETAYGSGTSGSAVGGDTSVTTVDGTRFVAAMAVDNTTFCSVGTITGTSIVFGAAISSGNNTLAVSAGNGHNAISVVHMDLGKIVVWHAGTSIDPGATRVGQVSGTNIIFESATSSGASPTGNLKLVKLSSTRLAFLGHTGNTSNIGNFLKARVGLLGATTVSFPASEINLSGSSVLSMQDHASVRVGSAFDAVAIDSTDFLVCWADNDPLNKVIRAVVCTANAGTHVIIASTETEPFGQFGLGGGSPSVAEAISIATLDANTVVLCAKLAGVPQGGFAKVGNIVAGPTVSWLPDTGLNSGFEFVSSTAGFGRMVAADGVNASKFVPFWIHFASPGDDKGSAVVGTVVV